MKILALILKTLIFLSSCGHLSTVMSVNNEEPRMRIEKLAVMTNPEADLVHDIGYRQFDWHSGPAVIISLDSTMEAMGVRFELPLISGEKLQSTLDVRAGTNFLRFEGLVQESKLVGTLVAQVDGEAVEIVLPEAVKQYQVSGVVKDIDGSPIAGAWVVVLDPVFYNIAVTDELGRYTMKLPSGEYDSIAAFDRRYPRERIEDYYWNFTADRHKNLDFQIGTIEAFRLTAGVSRQNRMLSGTFIAYSTDKIREFLDRERPTDMNDSGFFLAENTPELEPENIQFYLDECKLEGPILLERANILIPSGQIGKNLGYRFEVSYRECVIQNDYSELVIKLEKGKIKGGARLGSLRFL